MNYLEKKPPTTKRCSCISEPCSLGLPGLTVNKFSSRRVAGPGGTARHSSAQCGTERPDAAHFGSEHRHQLGQMVCGVTRGSRWRKQTPNSWNNPPDTGGEVIHSHSVTSHTHTYKRGGARVSVCYITEVEGLHCVICSRDLRFIAVVMETHTLQHTCFVIKTAHTHTHTLCHCGSDVWTEKLSEGSECLPMVCCCTFWCETFILLFSISARGGTITTSEE